MEVFEEVFKFQLHCDEDDLGFFRSILPSLSELDERDKFNFRLTVMNKVNEILYKPCEKSEVDDVEMKLTNGSPEKESASVVERTCDARATEENKATEETTAARGSTNSPRKPAPQASTKGGIADFDCSPRFITFYVCRLFVPIVGMHFRTDFIVSVNDHFVYAILMPVDQERRMDVPMLLAHYDSLVDRVQTETGISQTVKGKMSECKIK
ncbi:unnamed protein product [Nesidiocoris tenuis]|uniref:BESS domain-containing protein n=1 Tax=Nesidiocoris tenuis TaxID=355587 RepID=A0A6H5G5T6_9HEMI|nr:unnamed protein product [Nesidiocoris tenuis]